MPVCFGDRVFLIALFLENMRANGTVISGKRGQELAMSNKKSAKCNRALLIEISLVVSC